LRKPVEPASGSKRPTAVKPKKAVKPGASAKRQVIPPATRAQHRPPSTAKKSATFILDAPTGRDVAVAGSFNNWQPQDMTKGPDGLWRISVQLTPGTYQYKFLVDTQWQEDPSNPRKTPNEHGGFNSTCDVL
jgi:1,4-alpha-glucan branching enzyme